VPSKFGGWIGVGKTVVFFTGAGKNVQNFFSRAGQSVGSSGGGGGWALDHPFLNIKEIINLPVQ
jgi:hypothetical protein